MCLMVVKTNLEIYKFEKKELTLTTFRPFYIITAKDVLSKRRKFQNFKISFDDSSFTYRMIFIIRLLFVQHSYVSQKYRFSLTSITDSLYKGSSMSSIFDSNLQDITTTQRHLKNTNTKYFLFITRSKKNRKHLIVRDILHQVEHRNLRMSS